MGQKIGKVAFIGGGAMAEAIIKGILAAGLLAPEDITVSEPTAARREYLKTAYGVRAVGNNKQAVGGQDVVVLAIKPQMAASAVTEEVAAAVPESATVISITGSCDLAKLRRLIPDRPLIRVMPNTPLAVGAGMTAIAADEGVSEQRIAAAEAIFGAAGEVVIVAENQLEAITAVSGCGPGYVFVLIDALADAGVNAGLPRALAIKLAAQTFAGAGRMAAVSGQHPAALRDMVTSPGGTTIAGIHALEEHGVRAAFYDAVLAVLERSEELKGR